MPTTMSYNEWIQRTKLGITAVRSANLKAVDTALMEYNKSPSAPNEVRLRQALLNLIREIGYKDGALGVRDLKDNARNRDNAVYDLYAQVVLKRSTVPLDLKSELLKAAQGRIQAQIFGGVGQKTVVGPSGELIRMEVKKVGHLHDSDTQLRIVAEEIQSNLDCRIAYGPIKTLKSASRKVADDYAGDWYQVKDGVRLTVIATNNGGLTGVRPEKLIGIRAKIKEICNNPSKGLTILKNEETTADSKDNPCGYSGLNFVIRLNLNESKLTGWHFQVTKPGWPGEIQANIPAILYGKMSEEDLCKIFDKDGYNSLQSELDIEGGIAHVFYEIWRVDRKGTNGLNAAKLARRYHNYLRDPQGLQGDKTALKAEIKAFKLKNAAQFAKAH